MNPLSPLFKGVQVAETVAVTAVKLAFSAPRIVASLLGQGQNGSGDYQRATVQDPVRREPGSAAPGGTGRPAPGPRATPGRAGTPDAATEQTGAPPEPTSAAGASGGIGGTAEAPGAAAQADAPDPTAAVATEPTPIAPRRERREIDVTPSPATPRKQSEPSRAEVDRRRQKAREDEADAENGPDAVLSFGSTGEPGANLRVSAPWDGYDKMKAQEIVQRVKSSDDTVKAVVRLYEQNGKKRKSVLQATE